MIHVIDTHALVWFLEGNSRLSQTAEQAIRDTTVRLAIPTIVLAEIAFLYSRQRIGTTIPTVLAHVTSVANWFVYPLDEQVVQHLPTELDIHDAIIVATALLFRDTLGEQLAVLTKDASITSSGLVRVVL